MQFETDCGRNRRGWNGRKPSTVVGLILKSASDFSRHPPKSLWTLPTGASALFPLLCSLLPRDMVLEGAPPFLPCFVCTTRVGFTIASYQSKFSDGFAGTVGNKTCPESRFRTVPASWSGWRSERLPERACGLCTEVRSLIERVEWRKPPLLPQRSAPVQF